MDLEVYQYWLSRYFDAAWYSWYQQSYLPEMTGVPYAGPEGEPQDQAGDALTPEEAALPQFEDALPPGDAVAPQVDYTGGGVDLSASNQPLDGFETAQLIQAEPEFATQPSAALSTMAVQGSMMPDSALLGTDSPPSEEGALEVATAEEVVELSGPLSSEAQAGPELAEDYPLEFSLGATQDELSQQDEVPEEAELAQEDSFVKDQAAAAAQTATPTKGNIFMSTQCLSAATTWQVEVGD